MTSFLYSKSQQKPGVMVYVHKGEGCGDESMLEPGVCSCEYMQTFSGGLMFLLVLTQ